jgi:hypothetical protein
VFLAGNGGQAKRAAPFLCEHCKREMVCGHKLIAIPGYYKYKPEFLFLLQCQQAGFKG